MEDNLNKNKKMEDNLKKMEGNLQKNEWKITSKTNGRKTDQPKST